jgi:hypothetical protein
MKSKHLGLVSYDKPLFAVGTLAIYRLCVNDWHAIYLTYFALTRAAIFPFQVLTNTLAGHKKTLK